MIDRIRRKTLLFHELRGLRETADATVPIAVQCGALGSGLVVAIPFPQMPGTYSFMNCGAFVKLSGGENAGPGRFYGWLGPLGARGLYARVVVQTRDLAWMLVRPCKGQADRVDWVFRR